MPKSGLTVILVATAIAGVVSYFVTWLVPRVIGFAEYTTFAVFWAALYLLVGTLFGVQQEVTRGTRRVDTDAPNPARTFGLLVAVVTFAAVLATSPLWVGAVFADYGWGLVLPLAAGAASYAVVAVLGGTLFGLSEWRSAAGLLLLDALLRVIAVAIALAVTHDIVAIAWAVVVPFPLSILLVWPFVRSRVAGKATLDVGYRQLTWNVGRTVTAAAATGAMVSGFPLLFGLASDGEPASLVGMIILAATLVRAPLIVVVQALQGYLLVQFRDAPERASRRLLLILAGLAGAGLVLAALGWLLGPLVFGWLFPGEPVPGAGFIAVLVASSALVGSLSVTGAAVLARNRHHLYTAGWVTGALVTIVALLLPLDLEPLAITALIAGPAAGLAVHLSGLALRR
ncbi:O-antigen/teichoic acid export membrane protein [Microbacteriaceae bacterium SG_E_30_P1]|uniref:O-antigen/teichoic acid export membrane protein n=1 Tax=Antiquaquibacter oligotrophicus TaxID=2880260 RepID=A0ABT6KNZ2_9MICO|nr:hypothetical protein [Antiquaquibacter oligotrophicus]MDH6181715.1 O-antigen/teichoic acid export membrane protein [Antiquaquibacter oligotrophicus]UDF12602.1 hypothetical protein LH407_10615 [Antiquaquibacter oligotrophicus]